MTTHETSPESARTPHVDFVRQKVAADVAAGVDGGRVHTRFPPEPNGYLHLGHAKSICLNFGLAREFGGKCNLRFDDTNPTKESVEYVESIQRDVRWLGFDWEERLYYASDYFERLYELAVQLVRQGDAYVCDLDGESMRRMRGSLTEPGTDSPGRARGVAENLDLLARMRAGEFPEGARTLRARIDMASPNVLLRDPVMYRILHAHHHRTGDAWRIYPTYDWAHGQSDALEGITHSVCTLEFENHRPLYDWFLDRLKLPARPRQTEFARLSLSYTVLSKRKLLELVEGGHVTGWDDPRMPTLSGVRRLGYTPEALRAFCEEVGVTRVNGVVEIGVLQNALRADLNRRAPRRMAVLDPLELVIENWPAGVVDRVEAQNNPEDPQAGMREVPFSGRLFIERDDFKIDAPRKYFRLKPGGEVRLRYGYYVTATGFDTDAAGAVTRVRCTYDPATRGGDSPDGRKVKGTIHWVSAEHAVERELRLYDHLFAVPDPGEVEEGRDWKEHLNPDSLRVVRARLEPSLADAAPGSHWQFERNGYFCVDTVDSRPGAPIFNRSVALRDTWAKIEAKG
jgi:glutaminyl-tRNA synthetase